MASFPPLPRSPALDNFSVSLASYRNQALGGRKIRTRQTYPETYTHRTTFYEQDMLTGKFGPRTPLQAPISPFGSFSNKELLILSDRFSISQHRKRAETGRFSDVREYALPSKPVEEEEKKNRVVIKGADLADFASRLKGANPALLFCSKVVGDGHRPDTREGGTLTAVEGKLYLFGGRCRKLFNDIKVLDPASLRWDEPKLVHTLEGLPDPRVNHSTVAYKHQLIVYGGCERFNEVLQIRNCFNLIHFYDTRKSYI